MQAYHNDPALKAFVLGQLAEHPQEFFHDYPAPYEPRP